MSSEDWPSREERQAYKEKRRGNPGGVVKLSTILKFGKYKGKVVQEVFELDWSYLAWAKNSGVLRFDNECKSLLAYLKRNTIKHP